MKTYETSLCLFCDLGKGVTEFEISPGATDAIELNLTEKEKNYLMNPVIL